MPKKEIDYSNTTIYKIVCKDLNITYTYIGHTTNFKQRKSQHKQTWNNPNDKKYNYKVYQTIRDNGGMENWDIVEIERLSCVDFYDACKRERYWIEELGNLNKVIPTRTIEEWRNDNKEELLKKSKVYRENNKERKAYTDKIYREKNKDKMKDYKDKYYKDNKELLAQKFKDNYEKNKQVKLEYAKKYQEQNKEAIAEYRKVYNQKNKEAIAEKNKLYREKNVESIKEYKQIIMKCECGTEIRKYCIARHKRTKKHEDLMKKIIETKELLMTNKKEL